MESTPDTRGTMFLQAMIMRKLNGEGISVRKAAKLIGTSHTTLHSFLEGQTVDLETMVKICKWLNVSLRDALGFDVDSDTASAVSVVLDMEPELSKIFQEAAEDVRNGTLPADDFREIVRYAAYRLKTAKEQKQLQYD